MEYIKNYFFTDQDKLKIITEFLESKEQYLLQKYKFRSDFGTSLTDKHVSTRSGGYNVFQFLNECPELNDLLNFLAESYWDYYNNTFPKSAYIGSLNPAIGCWVNILRDGENIGKHKHSHSGGLFGWSFISASIILRAKNTCTRYMHEGEVLSIENTTGCLTVFPPYYDHWTDTHKDSQNRVTLGMDFFFDKAHSASNKEFNDALIVIPKL